MTHETRNSQPGATVAQPKRDIETGRTGDKVGGFDPAASPLGTDEEAGGVRPEAEIIALERVRQARPQLEGGRANAADPRMAPQGERPRATTWWMVAGVAAVLLTGTVFGLAGALGA